MNARERAVIVGEIILFHAVWFWVGYQLIVVGGAK